ncbi:MAG: hypothetical protein WAU68_01220 [Vitreimonas sp.]
MKALLAAGALCMGLALAVPITLAQSTTSSTTTSSSTTVTTSPATPSTPPSTTTSQSTTSTTPMPAGGAQTTTMTTSTTTTPGSCRTRHAAGEACSCRSAPTTIGTSQAQNGHNMCVVGG